MTEPSTAAVPLLRVDGLRVATTAAPDRPLVHGLDLRVDPGEVVALVGESGSGKSLTARAVLGLLPRGVRATGSVRLAGTSVLGAADRELDRVRGSVAALVQQDAQRALNPVQTVGTQLREALRLRPGHDRASARERALDLLRAVDLPEPERRLRAYPHELSGGQQQRVAIALALSGDPRLLVADEPTTALDVAVQAGVLDLLRRLRDERGLAVLLVTHDLGVVAEIADRVVVLRGGRVVEQAPVVQLFDAPREAYTRELLDAVPRLVPRPPDPPAPERTEALGLDGVEVSWGRGRTPALRGVSVRLAEGEVLGVVGGSGSGKSTLGRVALGLLRPTVGTVRWWGRDLAATSRRDLRRARRDVAFVPQDPAASLNPRWSVADCIAEPLRLHGQGRWAAARVVELLDAVHLPRDAVRRRPGELSGGQRQRVALARALALSPRLLVADEPTNALDVSVQARVLALFAQLREELGFAALFVSHDLAVVDGVADRVLVLDAGRVVEEGPTALVLGAPRHERTRALLDAVPAGRPRTPDTPEDPT